MTTELTMLAWSAALTAVLWIPYVLVAILRHGPVATLTYTAPSEDEGWYNRAKAAHRNAVENLVPFGALVLVAHAAGVSNEETALAAVTYFWARVAHVIVCTLGIPVARTIAFVVAWGAMVPFFLAILGAGDAATSGVVPAVSG